MKKLLEIRVELLVAAHFVWWYGSNSLNLFEMVMNITTFIIVYFLIQVFRKTIIEVIEDQKREEQTELELMIKRKKEKELRNKRMFQMLENM